MESVTVAHGRLELRVHRVVGAPPGAGVEQTGWATGPGERLYPALHPLHGWRAQDDVRAPHGTAYTPQAVLPRLTAPAEGAALYAALATLTAAGPDSEPLAGAVDEVTVDRDRVEVRWAADGSRTGVTFDPVTVHRTADREPEPDPDRRRGP